MHEKRSITTHPAFYSLYFVALIALLCGAAYRFCDVKWGNGIPFDSSENNIMDHEEMCWLEYKLIGIYSGLLVISLVCLLGKQNGLQESGIFCMVTTFIYLIFVVILVFNDVLERRIIGASLSSKRKPKIIPPSPEAQALNSIFSNVPDPKLPGGRVLHGTEPSFASTVRTAMHEVKSSMQEIISLLLNKENPSQTSVIDKRVDPVLRGVRPPLFVFLNIIGFLLGVRCLMDGASQEEEQTLRNSEKGPKGGQKASKGMRDEGQNSKMDFSIREGSESSMHKVNQKDREGKKKSGNKENLPLSSSKLDEKATTSEKRKEK